MSSPDAWPESMIAFLEAQDRMPPTIIPSGVIISSSHEKGSGSVRLEIWPLNLILRAQSFAAPNVELNGQTIYNIKIMLCDMRDLFEIV